MLRLAEPLPQNDRTCLPQRRPWAVAFLCLPVFWFFRAVEPGGDGDLIVRFIEAGAWCIKSEILGQASLQAVFQLVRPMGYDGRVATQVVGCLAGFFIVVGFLYSLRVLGPRMPWLGILFFSASGVFRLCFGYIEYYPQQLALAAILNCFALSFLRGKTRGVVVGLWFSCAVWVHQAMWVTLPALLLLPVLAGRAKEMRGVLIGLSPLTVLLLLREFPLYSPVPLEGHNHNWNFVPFVLGPESERFYPMLSFAHAADILQAAALRSVLAWPALLLLALARGREIVKRLDGITLFLLVQFSGFLFLSLTWHPNLGIPADWDLFAVEALPAALLLAYHFPPLLPTAPRRMAVAFLIAASAFVTWSWIAADARIHQRQFCSIRVIGVEGEALDVTVDGHARSQEITALHPGRRILKIISHTRGVSFTYPVVLVRGARIDIRLPEFGSDYDPVLQGVRWTPAASAGYPRKR